MRLQYNFQKIPQSRIATFDIFSIGLQKHHVIALLEFDVTHSREKLKQHRINGKNISFNASIIKAIAKALSIHQDAAAYLYNKRKLIIFDSINISFLVEKEIDGKRVPIPMVIENANTKTPEDITEEIENSKNKALSKNDIVLSRKTKSYEGLYYILPGFFRRMFWKFWLRHPKLAYKNMGNVAITSLGMIGRINGWFIHKSIHPISFGIGSVIKKPVVIDDEIQIREILNMTILIDHDVIDGAPMMRFVKDLTRFIESGEGLVEYV